MNSPIRSLATLIRAHLQTDASVEFFPNRRFAQVYSEGSPATCMYFVESGLVKTYKRGRDDREIILQIAGAGDLFGDEILANQTTRTSTAEIVEEGAIYVISRHRFLAFCEKHPQLWRELCELMAVRNHQLEKKIGLLYLHELEYRILFYLTELAESVGARPDGVEYSIPFSQSELADLVGAARETTSTILNRLARRGLIRLGRRRIVLVSMDGVLANMGAGLRATAGVP